MKVALVTNLCTHYRRPLFAALARRMTLDIYLTSRGAEWYWPAEQQLPGLLPDMYPAPSVFRLLSGLTHGGYDCMVASLTGRATLLAAFTFARVRRIPFVLWVGIWSHPETPFHRISRPVTRFLFRRADALVVYGPHVAEYIRRESGRTDRVYVAVQSIDNDLFRSSGGPPSDGADASPAGVLHACFVGRVEPEKGLDVLVRALALTCDRIELTIIGSGTAEPELRTLCRSLGISGRVHFAGRILQHALPAALRSYDCLVLPSIATRLVRESWGLVVNEAMNCGLPVIATDAVGAAAGGLVVDGETGLIVPDCEPVALARALETLADEPDARGAMGRNASVHVLGWNVEAASDGFVDAIDAAMEVGRKRVDRARFARA